MLTLIDLVSLAEDEGLTVTWEDLGARSGELRPGVIAINSKRCQLTQRVTIAHELGHYHYGHDWTVAHCRDRDERQADRYAAHLLIDAAEYRQAARLVEDDPRAVARELGVTARLIDLWIADQRYQSDKEKVNP